VECYDEEDASFNPHTLDLEWSKAIWRPLRTLLQYANAAMQRAKVDEEVKLMACTCASFLLEDVTVVSEESTWDKKSSGEMIAFMPDVGFAPADDAFLGFDPQKQTTISSMTDFINMNMNRMMDMQCGVRQTWWPREGEFLGNEASVSI
jgi:hypothetical protein